MTPDYPDDFWDWKSIRHEFNQPRSLTPSDNCWPTWPNFCRMVMAEKNRTVWTGAQHCWTKLECWRILVVKYGNDFLNYVWECLTAMTNQGAGSESREPGPAMSCQSAAIALWDCRVQRQRRNVWPNELSFPTTHKIHDYNYTISRKLYHTGQQMVESCRRGWKYGRLLHPIWPPSGQRSRVGATINQLSGFEGKMTIFQASWWKN